MMSSVDLSPFREELGRIKSPVEIVSFSMDDNCDLCPQGKEFLDELEKMAPTVKVRRYDLVRDREQAVAMGVDKVPAFLIPTGDGHRVRWYGLPMGMETKSFVNDLLLVDGAPPEVPDAVKDRATRISRPVHIQVFVTPTCPYCPRAAQLAHSLARLNPLVTADVIEANEFPTVSEVYGVSGVPKIVLNNLLQVEGMPQDDAFALLVEYAADPALLARALHNHQHSQT